MSLTTRRHPDCKKSVSSFSPENVDSPCRTCLTLSNDQHRCLSGCHPPFQPSPEKRRRATTDHSAEFQKIVAKLNFNVQKIQSELGLNKQPLVEENRTAFYIGAGYKKVNTVEPKPPVRYLWLTARHENLVTGVRGKMLVGAGCDSFVDFECVFDDELCDLSVVVSDHLVDLTVEPHMFGRSLMVTQQVYVVGFGNSYDARENVAAVMPGYVAHLNSHIVANKSAEEVEWKCARCFTIDGTFDLGFSGSPVLSESGEVLGMFCWSNKYAGGALFSAFIEQVLDANFVIILRKRNLS